MPRQADYGVKNPITLERGTPLTRAHFGFTNSPVRNGDRLANRNTGELVTLLGSSTFDGRDTIWVQTPFKGKVETSLHWYNFHQKKVV